MPSHFGALEGASPHPSNHYEQPANPMWSVRYGRGIVWMDENTLFHDNHFRAFVQSYLTGLEQHRTLMVQSVIPPPVPGDSNGWTIHFRDGNSFIWSSDDLFANRHFREWLRLLFACVVPNTGSSAGPPTNLALDPRTTSIPNNSGMHSLTTPFLTAQQHPSSTFPLTVSTFDGLSASQPTSVNVATDVSQPVMNASFNPMSFRVSAVPNPPQGHTDPSAGASTFSASSPLSGSASSLHHHSTRRACDPCRRRKVRCVRTERGVCTKCDRRGEACTKSAPKTQKNHALQ